MMILLLLCLFLCLPVESGDPLEDMIRNAVITARSMGEKFLSNIVIPRSKEVAPNLMFQMDPKTQYAAQSLQEFFNTCPVYLPVPSIRGAWFMTHISRKLLQTTMADVDETIDRLYSGVPITDRKSLNSLFRPEVYMDCVDMNIQNDTSVSFFEFLYATPSIPKSIIGQIFRRPDRSMTIMFGPTVELNVVLTYSSTLPGGSPYDILVFSQLDSFPKCDNYLVLQRSRTENIRLLEMLTAQGANFPSNPLIPLLCQQQQIQLPNRESVSKENDLKQQASVLQIPLKEGKGTVTLEDSEVVKDEIPPHTRSIIRPAYANETNSDE